jgi:hypothetical protein
MPKAGSSQVTALLEQLSLGNEAARDELMTLVYPELRRIAARYMRQERPGHTMRTTGLVHEVYVRLFGPHDGDLGDEGGNAPRPRRR